MEWRRYITISSDFEPAKQQEIAKTLDWLEEHFSGFKLALYHVKQSHPGKPVLIKPDTYTIADLETGEITLDREFKPYFILSADGKLRQMSLNEELFHELWHIGQPSSFRDASARNYEEWTSQRKDAYARLESNKESLQRYLMQRGVPAEAVHHYLPAYEHLDDMKKRTSYGVVRPEIIDDPTYKGLALQWLKSRRDVEKIGLRLEDQAVDQEDVLRAMLGKPPRSHYHAGELVFERTEELSAAEIAAGRGKMVHVSPPAPSAYPGDPVDRLPVTLYPLLSGQLDPKQVDMRTVMQSWSREFNADSRNITEAERRALEYVRRDMLKDKSVDDLTPGDIRAVEDVMKKMQEDFNRTANTDSIRPDTSALIRKHSPAKDNR